MTDIDKVRTKADKEPCDDIALALRSKDGDKVAFSTLVSKYHLSLRNYVRSFCPNTEDTEDICQECYRKAFMSIKSFNPEYTFKIWLFSIAKHTAIDHIRRHSNFTTVKINSGDETIPNNTDISENSPEDTMIDEQSYKQFLKAIEGLPDKYKQIAELRLIHDYSYDEIAKTLDLPLNTVRSRIRRAKVRIGEFIQEDYEL